MTHCWIPKTLDEVCQRAAGRRRYHARRQRARDERQLKIMGMLVLLNWPRYGIGRTLAKAFLVDPATISRDLNYIREWRARLLEESDMTESLADVLITRLVVAGIHPRLGYICTTTYTQGISSLSVRRGR